MAETKPPNLRTVTMPDCCITCKYYEEAAQSFPIECYRFHYRFIEPSDICDDFQRNEEGYPQQVKQEGE